MACVCKRILELVFVFSYYSAPSAIARAIGLDWAVVLPWLKIPGMPFRFHCQAYPSSVSNKLSVMPISLSRLASASRLSYVGSIFVWDCKALGSIGVGCYREVLASPPLLTCCLYCIGKCPRAFTVSKVCTSGFSAERHVLVAHISLNECIHLRS